MYNESAEEKNERGRKFKAAAIRAGYTARTLSQVIDCHINTIYTWYSDPSTIKISQLDIIATRLKLTENDIHEIFLPQTHYSLKSSLAR